MTYYMAATQRGGLINTGTYLARNWQPIPTRGLDRYTYKDWTGWEFNPVMGYAMMQNMVSNPFIKDPIMGGMVLPETVGSMFERANGGGGMFQRASSIEPAVIEDDKNF